MSLINNLPEEECLITKSFTLLLLLVSLCLRTETISITLSTFPSTYPLADPFRNTRSVSSGVSGSFCLLRNWYCHKYERPELLIENYCDFSSSPASSSCHASAGGREMPFILIIWHVKGGASRWFDKKIRHRTFWRLFSPRGQFCFLPHGIRNELRVIARLFLPRGSWIIAGKWERKGTRLRGGSRWSSAPSHFFFLISGLSYLHS